MEGVGDMSLLNIGHYERGITRVSYANGTTSVVGRVENVYLELPYNHQDEDNYDTLPCLQEETDLKTVYNKDNIEYDGQNNPKNKNAAESLQKKESEATDQQYTPRREAHVIKLTEHGRQYGGLFGVNVLKGYSYPPDLNNLSLTEIVKDINYGEKSTVVNLIKHVHAVVIPKLVLHNDTVALSKLLECNDESIQRRIDRDTQTILFQTEVRRHNINSLLESVELSLKFFRSRAASSDTLKRILPNVMLMLVLVHHIVINHTNKDEILQLIRNKLSTCSSKVDEVQEVHSNEVEKNILKATKSLISEFEECISSPKASRLQLGNWAYELKKDSTLVKLRDGLSKMSSFEHHSLVARLIIELNLELCEKQAKFLQIVLMSIQGMKKTEGICLHLLFITAGRGVVNVLNRNAFQDKHVEHREGSINTVLCDVLKDCLNCSKVSAPCKSSLSEDLVDLLFHKNANIASQVSILINHKRKCCLSDVVLHINRILEPLATQMHFDTQNKNQTQTNWMQIHGLIANYEPVSVYVQFPVNGTYNYRQYHQIMTQNGDTAMHLNSLEVMRHLSTASKHENIKQLLAFQIQPLPFFYMTERLSDASLREILLQERESRCWLSLQTLGRIVIDCMNAIIFLHDHKVIHRGITASGFHRRGPVAYVLSDFGTAKILEETGYIPELHMRDIEFDGIPTRWSSPESLIRDCYSVKSDTWMAGQMLTEIFAHGAQPYTEMYSHATEEVMEMVIFNDLKPLRWPCIPMPVHEIILKCLESDPAYRINPPEVLRQMELWMASLDQLKEDQLKMPITEYTNRGSEYPELDPQQKEMEWGCPAQLKQLKSIGGDPRVTYKNRLTERLASSSSVDVCIQPHDLTAPDHPNIIHKGRYLEVEEPVTREFRYDTFRKLSSEESFGDIQHIAIFPPECRERRSTNAEGLTHLLLYRCQLANSLEEIAQRQLYGDLKNNENAYLMMIRDLVEFVNWMHRNDWILRDSSCSTFYRAQSDNKVFMPRLGRMTKISKHKSCNDACVIDRELCIDDRRNWMPAEVIKHGHFSKSSDVYSLAMTINEFYEIASLVKKNPLFKRIEAVPFSKVEPPKLLETLFRGEFPERPDACSTWLFDLLKKCWNRDPTQRPSTKQILSELSKRERPIPPPRSKRAHRTSEVVYPEETQPEHMPEIHGGMGGTLETPDSHERVAFDLSHKRKSQVFSGMQPPQYTDEKNSLQSIQTFHYNELETATWSMASDQISQTSFGSKYSHKSWSCGNSSIASYPSTCANSSTDSDSRTWPFSKTSMSSKDAISLANSSIPDDDLRSCTDSRDVPPDQEDDNYLTPI